MNIIFKTIPNILIALILLPFLTDADAFMVHKEFPFFPQSYSFLILLGFIFLLVVFKGLIKNKVNVLFVVYRKSLGIIIPYGVLAFITLIWAMHPTSYWPHGLKDVAIDFYCFVVALFCFVIAQTEVLRKYHRAIFTLALLIASWGVWDSFNDPAFYDAGPGRAVGFTGNPNEVGKVIIFLAIASINWRKNDLWNLAALAISGMAIYPTLSAGNFLLFLLVFIFFTFRMFKKLVERRQIALIFLGLLIFAPFFLIPHALDKFSQNEFFADKGTQSRMEKLISMSQGEFSFASDHERAELIQMYIDLVNKAPLLGHGTNYSNTQRNQTHNIYLKYWVENGIFGLFAYLALLIGAFYHFKYFGDTRGMVFICILAFGGLFDENYLSVRPVVVLIGLLGAMAFFESSRPHEPIKTRKIENLSWSPAQNP